MLAAQLVENTVVRSFCALANPVGVDAYPIVTYRWRRLYDTYIDLLGLAAVKSVVQGGLTEALGFGKELGYGPLPEAMVE